MLAKEYVKAPSSEDDWKKISRDFYLIWKFPNCLGMLPNYFCFKHFSNSCIHIYSAIDGNTTKIMYFLYASVPYHILIGLYLSTLVDLVDRVTEEFFQTLVLVLVC